jgi:hypothetical protein
MSDQEPALPAFFPVMWTPDWFEVLGSHVCPKCALQLSPEEHPIPVDGALVEDPSLEIICEECGELCYLNTPALERVRGGVAVAWTEEGEQEVYASEAALMDAAPFESKYALALFKEEVKAAFKQEVPKYARRTH